MIRGLDDALLDRIVRRLVELEPAALGVIVTGSYAKGRATPSSDLDVTALTPEPRVRYRTWFEERPGAPPLHVSAGAKTLERWLGQPSRPAPWALGLPAVHDAVLVWATEQGRRVVPDPPSNVHPAGPPELEDLVEAASKARRAVAAGDPVGVRLYAQQVAVRVPRLLLPLNEVEHVRDRRQALDAALAFAVAPEGYAHDLPICLGVAEASDREAAEAVLRLVRELLALLRERSPDVDPQVAPYLADGTLERHLGFL